MYVLLFSLAKPLTKRKIKRDGCLVLGTNPSKDSWYVPESSASVKASPFLLHLDGKARNKHFQSQSPKFHPLSVKIAFSTGCQVHSCGSCRDGL